MRNRLQSSTGRAYILRFHISNSIKLRHSSTGISDSFFFVYLEQAFPYQIRLRISSLSIINYQIVCCCFRSLTRFLAISKNFLFFSKQMKCLLVLMHAIASVPEPQNASKTTSPSLLLSSTNSCIIETGFSVG